MIAIRKTRTQFSQFPAIAVFQSLGIRRRLAPHQLSDDAEYCKHDDYHCANGERYSQR
jgi:hypothetical protein